MGWGENYRVEHVRGSPADEESRVAVASLRRGRLLEQQGGHLLHRLLRRHPEPRPLAQLHRVRVERRAEPRDRDGDGVGVGELAADELGQVRAELRRGGARRGLPVGGDDEALVDAVEDGHGGEADHAADADLRRRVQEVVGAARGDVAPGVVLQRHVARREGLGVDDLVDAIEQRVGGLAVVELRQPERVREPRARVARLLRAVREPELAALERGEVLGERRAEGRVGAGEEHAHRAGSVSTWRWARGGAGLLDG